VNRFASVLSQPLPILSFLPIVFPSALLKLRPGGAPIRLAAGLACAVALAGCVSTPMPRVALDHVPPAQVELAAQNLQVFGAVWSLVMDKHFDPKLQGVDWRAAAQKFGPEAAAAKDKKELYAVINRVLEQLNDSHTHAQPPEAADERRTQVRARTGFNMTRLDGRWAVSEVVPGSPAELAGVRRGWLVVSRNGEGMAERTEIRPRNGEVARWEFIDDQDRPVLLDLTARPISTKPRQEARELPGGFIYLRFDGFDAPDRRWLSAQLKVHHDAPGVIIDLRQNPGGETFSLGITIGEFFDRSVDCGTFISRDGYRGEKNSWQLGSARYTGRVAVLIARPTASAAEIFSAVLQDHHRAVLIGRKSAGAVLASWFYRLPDGGELQLSREDYRAPKGRRLEGNGIEPDIASTLTLADLRAGRDPDLDTALAALQKN
jgi:carboxyl-terminal processing protease